MRAPVQLDTIRAVRDAADTQEAGPKGTGLLPPRRTTAEIATAPRIDDLDKLLIEDLPDDEFQVFLDAISS